MEAGNSRGTWQEMLSKKYLKKKVLSQHCKGSGGSHFWQSLMGVNEIFQQFTIRKIGDGAKTQFWEDVCLNGSALACQFPRLYRITFTKHVTVKEVKEKGMAWIQFRRTLYG